ncbi:hypothetical protein M404DRAFT_733188 [Pisolithus tinctorius Marx 270]|uniref:Uncharacterized protein n=1 Tax=Pisolithus tinctorius Marx 270 TaxID=870435 RepID=A0A0C3P1Q0_PISTI|nr:hypothetical protein M404DRAFT_733188 [Pisolithus tinctorius Marx 270]
MIFYWGNENVHCEQNSTMCAFTTAQVILYRCTVRATGIRVHPRHSRRFSSRVHPFACPNLSFGTPAHTYVSRNPTGENISCQCQFLLLPEGAINNGSRYSDFLPEFA